MTVQDITTAVWRQFVLGVTAEELDAMSSEIDPATDARQLAEWTAHDAAAVSVAYLRVVGVDEETELACLEVALATAVATGDPNHELFGCIESILDGWDQDDLDEHIEIGGEACAA